MTLNADQARTVSDFLAQLTELCHEQGVWLKRQGYEGELWLINADDDARTLCQIEIGPNEFRAIAGW